MLPTGSQTIVQARMNGKRPAELVIVSMVGRLPEANTVILDDGDDWRFVEGMQVCVFAKRGTKFRDLCKAIGYCGPKWLGLWDVERKQGADAFVVMKLDSIDKARHDINDFDVVFDPWIEWQNKKFEGVL